MKPDAEFLFRLADAAAHESLPLFRVPLEVDDKGAAAFDPVTEADRRAEKAMRDLIAAEFPEHAVLGEEYGASGEGGSCWVLDPIDGTRAFISGIPVWGTLIGYMEDGRATMGLMDQPYTGERFWAADGAAWLDGPRGPSPLKVRDTQALSQANLFTTTPRLFKGSALDRFLALEGAVRQTRFGTDCYAFAMLAAGFVDLVVEPGLQPYDIVALVPIIEAAGGVITTFSGGRPEAGGDVIAAATPALHEAAMALLASD
ncbi:histidinol-phosphatase [Consotaella salsifontis]|uniref:Histidinol-phosphatase n=1 Tax=Consotaella salsifontis TaxID=1365950 RepID=A0A1T4RA12_9HYPH|nr:histidinol-phosphatase [Consotaella salsifontis]SKA12518.1 histidinol-phosphatase, inositol monophosphatase family [Consotaella salsifontis]